MRRKSGKRCHRSVWPNLAREKRAKLEFANVTLRAPALEGPLGPLETRVSPETPVNLDNPGPSVYPEQPHQCPWMPLVDAERAQPGPADHLVPTALPAPPEPVDPRDPQDNEETTADLDSPGHQERPVLLEGQGRQVSRVVQDKTELAEVKVFLDYLAQPEVQVQRDPWDNLVGVETMDRVVDKALPGRKDGLDAREPLDSLATRDHRELLEMMLTIALVLVVIEEP